jgi:hypothetical protein
MQPCNRAEHDDRGDNKDNNIGERFGVDREFSPGKKACGNQQK